MTEEIWKDVDDYDGFYQVSNLGNIRSFLTKKYRTRTSLPKSIIPFNRRVSIKNSGYLTVDLSGLGKFKNKKWSVHRLVALHFIPNPDNKPDVNHLDGNKLNNCVNNLQWSTKSENSQHMWDSGLIKRTQLKIIKVDFNFFKDCGLNPLQNDNKISFKKDLFEGTYCLNTNQLIIKNNTFLVFDGIVTNKYDMKFIIRIFKIKHRNEYHYKSK